MSLIECKDICKNFGEKVALDHVSLEIPKGQIFGLLGPNGAGKTTILNLVIGFIKTTEGRILIDGLDLNTLNLQSYRSHICCRHQLVL